MNALPSQSEPSRPRAAGPLLVVQPDGRVRCLYTERLRLDRLGRLHIRRVSLVEPDPQGRWFVAILGGPVLGPFSRRSLALKAERRWLRRRLTDPAEPSTP